MKTLSADLLAPPSAPLQPEGRASLMMRTRFHITKPLSPNQTPQNETTKSVGMKRLPLRMKRPKPLM